MSTSKKQQQKIQPVEISLAGKVPPNNLEAERAVLGILMLEPATLDTTAEILKDPVFFYALPHQKIYQAILTLRDKGQSTDSIAVAEQLTKDGTLEQIGGRYELVKLTNGVVSSAGLETHARIIAEKHMLRRLATVSSTILHQAYDDRQDAFELIDYAEREIAATNLYNSSRTTSVASALEPVMARIEDLRHIEEDLTGVTSGLHNIDRITCGWQPTDLIVLAARPSVGKTALALNFAHAAAKAGTPVGFFTLEMSTAQLTQRLLAIQSRMQLRSINRGRLDDEQMRNLTNKGADPLAKLPIFIDDTPGLQIYELRSKARKLVKKHSCGLLIIDYLQLMSGMENNRTDNREQEISKISRDLKRLAKELEIPIIALSQLSREVEKRKDKQKMPILSDLRESGAIEQDADLVAFIYRPDYYEILNDEQGNNTEGETHVKFAKHRSGALETAKLKANLRTQIFEDIPDQAGLATQTVQVSKGSKMTPVNGSTWQQHPDDEIRFIFD